MTSTTDLANGAELFEMMQELARQMATMNSVERQRFHALETRTTVVVAPVQSKSVDSIITSQQTTPPPITTVDSSLSKAASSNMVRSLDRDMPLLTDDNYSEWVDHAVAYCGAAGWGDEEVPAVFTDINHAYTKDARKFFWNKTSSEWKVLIKLANLDTATALWDWLKTSASATAESNRFLNLD